MKTLLLAGTAGLMIFGATAAYASNPNVPNWSPYAIMAYDSTGPAYANPGYGGNPGYPPELRGAGPDEGRAAYIDSDYRYRSGYSNGGYADPHPQNTGYDNARENSAYPAGFGDAPRY
jgi:hypothetical protein